VQDGGKAVVAGFVSGAALGVFLKIAEARTGFPVYTLLLNVDYVPFLGVWPEWAGFGLHLGVAVAFAWVLLRLLWRGHTGGKAAPITVLFGVAVALLLWPTALLSESTPIFRDTAAFGWWMTGHLM
jgi:hypothetical protein